jgi:cyclophilin family peptidyl-prolyl cis-trans isomerase/HEAT repeat protein
MNLPDVSAFFQPIPRRFRGLVGGQASDLFEAAGKGPWSVPRFYLLVLATAAPLRVEAQQGTPAQVALMQSMLAAEDRRGLGRDSIRPLLDGLRSPHPDIRAMAARGLGRLERPEVLTSIFRLTTDPVSLVRREAINAVAQGSQGLARRSAPNEVSVIMRSLSPSIRVEREPAVLGDYARALGRLPYRDSSTAAEAQRVIAGILRDPTAATGPLRVEKQDVRLLHGVAHGLYSLARARRRTGSLSRDLLDVLVRASRTGRLAAPPGGAASDSLAAEVRRLSVLALTASAFGSPAVAADGLRDPDAQVRRLAVAYLPAITAVGLQSTGLEGALADPAVMVRLEAVRVYRTLRAASDCRPLAAATRDASVVVQLAAIDALGACRDSAVVRAALQPFLATVPASRARVAGRGSWHAHAHALVALARADSLHAPALAASDSRHPIWQVRMYAARAARIGGDSATLTRLAHDNVGSVRESAIDGLSQVLGHGADARYVQAIASPDYHVVLAAARALRGTTVPDAALPALFQALERLSAEQRDNSRDPRVEVLTRIGELAKPADSARISPRVGDRDEAIARQASEILSRWTGREVVPAPRGEPAVSDRLGVLASGAPMYLRVEMSPQSGGGHFVVRLRPAAATATVARLLALAQRGYYDGLTFHRVEPNFVIQGGSPAMTEYVGDASFLRDELDLASHLRGTVGISTRGRDTGDAQIFVNLVDNFRLDHDYTVVGEVVEGMDVVDGILEGDVMQRVTVVRR